MTITVLMTPISNTVADRVGTWNRLFMCAAMMLVILLIFPTFSRSQPMEYLLKAGFLEKFARFTDWPEAGGLDNADEPFVISVIGESPFKGSLEKLYHTEKIKQRPVRIRYISHPEEINDSRLLFIAESEKKNLNSILAAVRGKPILVVSDTNTFGRKGCHINIYLTPKGTLHFEINLKKVKESGLHMQLVLLEIAKIID